MFFKTIKPSEDVNLEEPDGKLKALKNFLEILDCEIRTITAGELGSGSKMIYYMCRSCSARQVAFDLKNVAITCPPPCGHRMRPVHDLPKPGTTVRYVPEFIREERRLFLVSPLTPGIYQYTAEGDRRCAFRFLQDLASRDDELEPLKPGNSIESTIADDGWVKVVFTVSPPGDIR